MLLKIEVFADHGETYEIVYVTSYLSKIEAIMPPLRYAFYKGFRAVLHDMSIMKDRDIGYKIVIKADGRKYCYFVSRKYEGDLLRYEVPSAKDGRLLIGSKTVPIKDIEKKYRVKLR